MDLARRPWRLISPQNDVPPEKLSAALNVSPLLARLLLQRGYHSPERAQRFLEPRLAHMTPPEKMLDMDRAVARILRALDRKEKVRVFGDYDVDGQSSTSILYLFFKEIGLDVSWELPHRHRDGYGLNPLAVDRAANDGINLLVTCDCGISNAKEVAYALERGIETVVIDHHRTPPELPPAAAVLNPHQPKCPFPFKGMCAAGVSFYLCIGVRAALRQRGAAEPDLREYLDLVALGTVADVVPLVEENRIFVRFGLGALSIGKRPGIKALKSVARVNEGQMSSMDVGFRLAPRLNAAGRLDDAGRGVRLLISDNYEEALRIAEELDRENNARREIEKQILDEAVARLEANPDPNRRSIVLASESWHHGVIGIVASRLVEKYYLPTALIAIEGDKVRGSARGVAGIHLFDTFAKMGNVFARFGGHAAAAGFTIMTDRIKELETGMEALAKETFPKAPQKELKLEAEITLSRLDEPFYEDIWRMAPFGQENPEPLLMVRGVDVKSSRMVGNNHLKLQLQQGNSARYAIGFGMGTLHPLKGPVDVAFYAQRNSFRNEVEIELRLNDLKPAGGL
jgi:single-stranded-DNA-specific exonuclease